MTRARLRHASLLASSLALAACSGASEKKDEKKPSGGEDEDLTVDFSLPMGFAQAGFLEVVGADLARLAGGIKTPLFPAANADEALNLGRFIVQMPLAATEDIGEYVTSLGRVSTALFGPAAPASIRKPKLAGGRAAFDLASLDVTLAAGRKVRYLEITLQDDDRYPYRLVAYAEAANGAATKIASIELGPRDTSGDDSIARVEGSLRNGVIVKLEVDTAARTLKGESGRVDPALPRPGRSFITHTSDVSSYAIAGAYAVQVDSPVTSEGLPRSSPLNVQNGDLYLYRLAGGVAETEITEQIAFVAKGQSAPAQPFASAPLTYDQVALVSAVLSDPAVHPGCATFGDKLGLAPSICEGGGATPRAIHDALKSTCASGKDVVVDLVIYGKKGEKTRATKACAVLSDVETLTSPVYLELVDDAQPKILAAPTAKHTELATKLEKVSLPALSTFDATKPYTALETREAEAFADFKAP